MFLLACRQTQDWTLWIGQRFTTSWRYLGRSGSSTRCDRSSASSSPSSSSRARTSGDIISLSTRERRRSEGSAKLDAYVSDGCEATCRHGLWLEMGYRIWESLRRSGI